MVRNLTSSLKQETSTDATPQENISLATNLNSSKTNASSSPSTTPSPPPPSLNQQSKQESDVLMSNLSSSSSSSTSSSSDLYTFCPQTSNNSNFCTYICIISDLTDPSNTCRRHVINLSSNLSIESLIQEAANYFSYDPNSFNLMWKTNNEEKKVFKNQIWL
jgi:hypothetical protein